MARTLIELRSAQVGRTDSYKFEHPQWRLSGDLRRQGGPRVEEIPIPGGVKLVRTGQMLEKHTLQLEILNAHTFAGTKVWSEAQNRLYALDTLTSLNYKWGEDDWGPGWQIVGWTWVYPHRNTLYPLDPRANYYGGMVPVTARLTLTLACDRPTFTPRTPLGGT